MARRGPAHRVRFLRPPWHTRTNLAPCARYEIVDSVPAGVLEVVLVPAEAGAHAPLLEEFHHRIHAVGVAMLRACAERRVMAEGHTPPDAPGRRRRERLPEKFLVLRVLEQPSPPEEVFLRGIDAHELDVRG